MDQLKPVLAALKKHYFWIVCSIILLVYLGTWFMTTSKMSEETTTRNAKITKAFDSGKRISQVTNHPNDESIEMMKGLTTAEAQQVRLAWELRYREQEDVLVWPEELLADFIAAVDKLRPIELTVEYPTPANKELKEDFRSRYRDYIRDELPKLAKIIGSEWLASSSSQGGMGGMGGMMGGYPGMPGGSMGGPGMGPAAMGMSPGAMGMSPGMPGMGMGGGGDGMGRSGMPGSGIMGMPESRIVVEWSRQNQELLQASSFNWTLPNTLQILYSQEDLWVLRSLMLVIKETNGDADAQYNAAVKEILALDLGASAAGIKMVGMLSTGGGMAGMMAGYPGMGSMGAGGMPSMGPSGPGTGTPGGPGATPGGGPGGATPGMMGPGGSSNPYGNMGMGNSAASDTDPADNRYVDAEMEPLTGERLRSAMASNQPADAFLAVAKRMPVRVRFRMNVLKLPLLLCNLADATLPVEVRQVRINAGGAGGGMGGMGGMPGGPQRTESKNRGPSAAGGSSMSVSAGAGALPSSSPGGGMPGIGGMGGSGGYMGMMGGSGGGYPGMGGGYPGMSAGMGEMSESPYDATVEIYGLIYIYNPVDPAKLGLEEEKAEGAAATEDASGSPAAAGEPGAGEPADDAADAAADPSDSADATDAADTAEGETTEEPDADQETEPAAEPATEPAAEPGAETVPPAADTAPVTEPAADAAEGSTEGGS